MEYQIVMSVIVHCAPVELSIMYNSTSDLVDMFPPRVSLIWKKNLQNKYINMSCITLLFLLHLIVRNRCLNLLSLQ